MKDLFTAILRFLLGAGHSVFVIVLVALGYYLAKN
jgi:uncharacterized membrane protein